MLTPFTSTPKVEFDRIKLGKSGIRRLIVRNPGDKAIEVYLDKLPKEEKGFSIDYVAFELGGKEETTLLIGWTPTKGGNVRENFIVRFGKFSAQVILIGSCIAPEVKSAKGRFVSNSRPLAPKNTNIKPCPKGRPSVPASKISAPKIAIPTNPVVRKLDSPPKRIIGGVSPLKAGRPSQSKLPPPMPKRESFICGGEFSTRELPYQSCNITPRRETYVHERPQPKCSDIVESTPIFSNRTETIRDIRRETMLIDSKAMLDFGKPVPIMPPPQSTEIRRQTFAPDNFADINKEMSRRDTYVKLPIDDTATAAMCLEDDNVDNDINIIRNEECTKLPSAVGFDFKEVKDGKPEGIGDKDDVPLDLSLAALNLSSKPKVLTDMLAEFLENSSHESLNLRDREKASEEDVYIEESQACLDRAATPLRLSNGTPCSKPYCPQVSDISLPDTPPSVAPVVPNVKVSDTPVRDPRLLQIMKALSVSRSGSLDLSLGSQFGDCSMAVNLASPDKDREVELEDELELIEANKENWDEDELELIAQARGTSAMSKSNQSPRFEHSERLSSGTIVKNCPTVDPEVLPVIASTKCVNQNPFIQTASTLLLEEKIVQEVTEQTFQVHYEENGGERKESSRMGFQERKVMVQKEKIRTPMKTLSKVDDNLDVSQLVEAQLTEISDKVRGRVIVKLFCLSFLFR